MQTHAHTHPVAGLFIFWELQPTAQSAITQVFVGQYHFLGKWLHFSSQNFFYIEDMILAIKESSLLYLMMSLELC